MENPRAGIDLYPAQHRIDTLSVILQPETVIQREVYLDGKNVCRVNGSLVSVSILRKLGVQLINIHGQHDSASLFDDNNHLILLDAFSGNEPLRREYGEKHETYTQLQRQIASLTMDEGEKLRKMEMLRYQIQEIEKAKLTPGEDETLEQRRKLLQNSEKISDNLHDAVNAVYGGEDTDGAASLLGEAERSLSRLSRFSEDFTELHQQVADLMYQVQDVAEELRSARDDLSYSADELEEIESRLDVIHRLRKKYGATCQDILDYKEKASQELDEIVFSDDHLERLKAQCEKAKEAAWEAAKRLRQSREAGAQVLSRQILSETASGADLVAFYMSANAGEALKPLSKVASGGELARIMLAMKNVLAQQDQVATLIFDEVDTGVSGRAAQKVAEKLRSVSQNKQVLCVTHLPQLAALATTHFLIAKEERDGRTYTSVTPLDKEGRKRELARIIGGANITETTLKSAEEMLNS